VFPRKTDVQKNHEHKSVHVYNWKSGLGDSKDPIFLTKNFVLNSNAERKSEKSPKSKASSNGSKNRKSKHKRQATLFKFTKQDNSCDRAKAMFKTSSNWSVEFQSETFDARTAKFGKGKSKLLTHV
jgi:hypothetical protein